MAEGSFERGKKWTMLKNLSTMVSMTVFPSLGCRLVTKSIEMHDHGCLGTGRGQKSSGGLWTERSQDFSVQLGDS